MEMEQMAMVLIMVLIVANVILVGALIWRLATSTPVNEEKVCRDFCAPQNYLYMPSSGYRQMLCVCKSS